MQAGPHSGKRVAARLGIGTFVGEGGYTTVAVACALLVSVSLVFCLATVEWALSRTAGVQEVADAAALAGANTVGAFYTVAQVIDACVLSMGLMGMAMLGGGLVLAAVPGAQAVSAQAMEAGKGVIDARNSFARSAGRGLRALEDALPAIAALNAASCAKANGEGGVSYAGAAALVPLESQSDYSSLEAQVSEGDVDDAADGLRDATQDAEDARRRADEARERAWEADCVDNPSCLRSRAESLAGLGTWQNPHVASPEEWNFSIAIVRSRAYYASRLEREAPTADDVESLTDSEARRAFYTYALSQVNEAYYYEHEDGTVQLHVPHLARNSSEMRETWLYREPQWPCTLEGDHIVLHSTLACTGATGEPVGSESVAAIEEGRVLRCGVCRMDVGDLGAVASISTIASNGYEHYWQVIVEEAQAYELARSEQAQAERGMRDAAERGQDAFADVLAQLAVPRPRLRPPGSLGCVSLVRRKAGTTSPSELSRAFAGSVSLPAGVAVSAAALAPDEVTGENNVVSRFLDGLGAREGLTVGGMLDGIAGIWGELLVQYGSAYRGIEGTVGGFLDGIDGVFGGTVGRWLKQRIGALMGGLGLEPADMRLRKPVIVGTQEVLERAGMSAGSRIRQVLRSLPADATGTDVARAMGVWLLDEVTRRRITIADLPIPGTGRSVPLTLDLSALGVT